MLYVSSGGRQMQINDMNQTWTCPKCKKLHTRLHWKDHHQTLPNWKDNLDKHYNDKGSNIEYMMICETCDTVLTLRPTNKIRNAEQATQRDWCTKCNKIKKGIQAPNFCPHCGWVDTRIILVRQ
jgi:predicted RNA-binding Zn-ribbon protein involved in translation (DUF1610 family)